jgi:hypothetical protein
MPVLATASSRMLFWDGRLAMQAADFVTGDQVPAFWLALGE